MEATWDFVRTVFTSPWGVVNVIVLLSLGSVWGRKRGSLLVAVAVILLVALGGFAAPDLLGVAADRSASSPAEWTAASLDTLDGWTGSVGWGTLVIGAILAILFMPSLRERTWLLALNHRVALVARRRGKEAGARFRLEAMQEHGVNPVGQFLRVVIVLGGLVSLWIALRDMSGSSLAFPAIGISDLSAPSLRPLLDANHLAVGLVTGAVAALGSHMRRPSDSGAQAKTVALESAISVGSWLMASVFVPAGVLLAAAGYHATQVPATPLLRPSPSSLPRVPANGSGQSVSGHNSSEALLRALGAQLAGSASGGDSRSTPTPTSGSRATNGSGTGRARTSNAVGGASSGSSYGSVDAAGKTTSADQRADLLDIMQGRKARAKGAGAEGRCGELTKSGKPCRNRVVEGSDRCHLHQGS